MTNARVEMNDEMMDMVNGGNLFDDFCDTLNNLWEDAKSLWDATRNLNFR